MNAKILELTTKNQELKKNGQWDTYVKGMSKIEKKKKALNDI
jgi:hypothetical protein